jgi:hypothetical protein
MTGLLWPLLPGYEREGKSYLTIAIGCTGGRHRSVFVARRLAQWLEGKGRRPVLRHRDLGRGIAVDALAADAAGDTLAANAAGDAPAADAAGNPPAEGTAGEAGRE